MNLREAAEMALRALENACLREFLSVPSEELNRQTIKALRQALAQPEQEPVAWITDGGKGELGWRKTTEKDISLYTAPPKREWVGLTDEEIIEIKQDSEEFDYLIQHLFARSIEAKLKEKNG